MKHILTFLFLVIILTIPASYSQESKLLKWKEIDDIDFDSLDMGEIEGLKKEVENEIRNIGGQETLDGIKEGIEEKIEAETEAQTEEKNQEEYDYEGLPKDAFSNLSRNAKVHVIGVKNGSFSGRIVPKKNFHPKGKVTVNIKRDIYSPVILVLTSYEPVVWTIRKQAGVDLEAVILSGEYKQKAIGVGSKTQELNISGKRNRDVSFYAWDESSADYEYMAGAIRHITGKEIKTFQGAEDSKKFYLPAIEVVEEELEVE